jgi:RsiW-degrading membrane proteinase PrsW (M82 family)
MATQTFDWRKLVQGIAPAIGTALGGPLAGAAIAQIGQVLLGKPDATENEVAGALQSGQLTGEQIVALKTADQEFAVRMKSMDIDVMKINQAADLALIVDTADARHQFATNDNVFVMGCIILGVFAVLMGLVLTGCFFLMTGKVEVDPSTMAVCAGLIGTVVGYVAANAQQVVSFFYGSSKGSKDSGDRLGAALTESIKQQAATNLTK